MAETAPRPGQLDDISLRMGELIAGQRSLEKYIHDREHGLNNLSQEVKGMALDVSRQIEKSDLRTANLIEKLDQKVAARLDDHEGRIHILEGLQNERTGVRKLLTWLFQTQAIGWLVAGTLAVGAFIARHYKL